MPQAKVAIFDLGETLIAIPPQFEEETRIAKIYDVDDEYIDFLSQQICLSRPGLTSEQYVELLIRHLERKTGIKAAEQVGEAISLSIHESILQPDALTALSVLRERGIARCLISNTNPLSWDRVRLHGLESFFDHIIFSCDVGLSKPDPRIFELAFKHFGYDPNNFCVVGDKVRTIVLGVAHLGTTTILVERRSDQMVVSDKLPVNAVVPHLNALCDLEWLGGQRHA